MTVRSNVPADRRDLLRQAPTGLQRSRRRGAAGPVSDDVDWPDGERSLHGKEEVRSYWTEPWTQTRTHDEPVSFSELDDGRTAVHLSQVVRSLEGSVMSQGRSLHMHRIEGDPISRMDIEAVPGP